MSEENKTTEEGLSLIQKLMLSGAAFIFIGYFMVWSSKNKSTEQMGAATMISTYAALQSMANRKCPLAIKQKTGEQVFFPSDIKSDRNSYITMTWEGGDIKTFKKAECTLTLLQWGITKLVIDDHVVIEKDDSKKL